ncbi:cytidine deaminase [Spiroplasma taiwanense]|uniref:Cytidine deaminase n=1 Tax=Spiroplasma taiwanense CT-1 TaxID=1276220 RepID=S5M099_9MOLU|nr:cytidine deaminase [Spiroplasma taiwanense]AGR41417.1 cytidine deaminase [Spiroplasma taiwanense CT-1]
MSKLNQEEVYAELKKLKENAYVPYSKFKVSCIIYLKNGIKVFGVNVENAAYNPTICAERTALSQLITQGYNKNDIEMIALYTDSNKFGSPCGTCRQTLSELVFENQSIWVYNNKEFLGCYTVKDFLPYSFSFENLT